MEWGSSAEGRMVGPCVATQVAHWWQALPVGCNSGVSIDIHGQMWR